MGSSFHRLEKLMFDIITLNSHKTYKFFLFEGYTMPTPMNVYAEISSRFYFSARKNCWRNS